jgi:hypothetical protein
MEARALIDQSAFLPDDVQNITTAFDEAWAQVKPKFRSDEEAEARIVLAKAILAAAKAVPIRVAILRNAGIDALARLHPTRFLK